MWILDKLGSVANVTAAPIDVVAFATLDHIRSQLRDDKTFHPGNIINEIRGASQSLRPGAPSFSGTDAEKVADVVREAIGWLQSEGLIADAYNTGSPGWHMITRRGATIKSHSDLSSYAKRAYLPREVLVEEIERAAVAPFLAGRYEDAVRNAFGHVEIAVRKAARYGNNKYGAQMMRDAFYPGGSKGKRRGPLTDPGLEPSEREGVSALFAGAMGYIKNPLSHREVGIDDARVAASRILLANDLIITLNGHVAAKKARRK